MKKTLGLVFAAALIGIPALTVARSYEAPVLSCVATYPAVSLGNVGRFNVISNVSGPFMWVADSEDYGVYNAGREFVTPFTRLGTQQVTVVWGSKRANCYVDVVPQPGLGEVYNGPRLGDYQDGYFGGYDAGPNVTISSVAYPALPNAGIEPQTFAAIAFAVVLLMGTSIALYPYARKAITVAVR